MARKHSAQVIDGMARPQLKKIAVKGNGAVLGGKDYDNITRMQSLNR
jgi:hypothetical protein